LSQTSTDVPSDPKLTLVSVADGDSPPDQMSRDLHDIALANRVLAGRVAELDAELRRQMAAAERLHTQVAVEMQRAVAAEQIAALAALQPSWLARCSSLPRRAIRRLRRMVRSR
jgi:hypothetical protein